MADRLTKKQRSALMARIRSKRTTPEMLVHGILKGKRVRHQMWPDWLHGHPDVWIEPNIVVFVNGCFWHGCPRHWKRPKTNAAFWREKIARNARRQRSVARRLRKNGWSVRVVWEHDLRKNKGRPKSSLSRLVKGASQLGLRSSKRKAW